MHPQAHSQGPELPARSPPCIFSRDIFKENQFDVRFTAKEQGL